MFESMNFQNFESKKEPLMANNSENLVPEEKNENEEWMDIVDKVGVLEGAEQQLWSKYLDYAKQAEVLHEKLDTGEIKRENTENMFVNLRASMNMEDLKKEVGEARAAELEELAAKYLEGIKHQAQ